MLLWGAAPQYMFVLELGHDIFPMHFRSTDSCIAGIRNLRVLASWQQPIMYEIFSASLLIPCIRSR